jgi:hypothetical protein
LLQNNTDSTLPVTLFTTNPNLSGNINGNPLYSWNITAQNLNQLTTVALQVRAPGAGGFVSLTAPISTNSVQGVLDALNVLNVGFFIAVVSGGSTFIQTANSIFVFANLTVNQIPQLATWQTTPASHALFNNAGINNASLFSTDQRSVTIISGTTGVGVFPQDHNYTFNNDFPFAILQDGDTIRNQMTASPGGPYSFHMIIKENGITILNSILVGNIVNFDITYHLNALYDFNAVVT